MRKDQWRVAAFVTVALLIIAVIVITVLIANRVTLTSVAGQLESNPTPTKQESTLEATEEPTEEATKEPTKEATEKPVEDIVSNDWDIVFYDGATDQMDIWTEELKDLNPQLWPEFPNVDNPSANFQAKDGLEYGMAESSFCQQDERCDIVIPAMHYRIITGDYSVAGYECAAGEQNAQGCALMLINIGVVSASFEDASVDSGFTVFGRYWNGDAMPVAIWAGLSHVSGNMLNLNSTLNQGGVNAGANCSTPGGCTSVEARFLIISGNEVLVEGVTTVER